MDRTVTNSRSFANPLHAILLAFPVALYPAALLTDITYLNTAEIQWSNFSSWLIAGADPVSYTHLTLPTNREV